MTSNPPECTPSNPRAVWLDVDPGHDDALALILAGYTPSLRVLGVSTVHGNQEVDKTTINACKVLTTAGLTHIEVVKGQAKPLVRPSTICPEIHGTCGLGGSSIPLPQDIYPRPVKHAIIHMYDTIMAQDTNTTIIATGAQTNVALLLAMFPDVRDKLDSIVFMGGAIGAGNTGPTAEFNIQIDPEAARIVMDSGVRIVMVPLEVTHTALVTKDIISALEAMGTTFATLIKELLLFFAKTYKDVFRFKEPPLHDPCAVAYVAYPHLFTTEFMRVDIECSGQFTAGTTVCDQFHLSNKPKNVHVATHMNVAAFWKVMLGALALADRASPVNQK